MIDNTDFRTVNPNEIKWWVEFPANPNVLNLHTREQWTHEMAENYFADSHELPGTSFVASLLSIEDLSRVDVLRHQFRLRKERGADWSDMLSQIQTALGNVPANWCEVSDTQKERKVELFLPNEWQTPERAVFEGVAMAQKHPLAKELFAVPGVIMARLKGETLTVKRGLAYTWETLLPKLEKMLVL